MSEPTLTEEDREACAGCGRTVDREIPDPLPDDYECMWSEAMVGRALYCQACYDYAPLYDEEQP